ncbi:MAG TPA: TlpA disulfide reductase family protein [Actinomycetota bacterium]|nr:TlpA disulfide reductase family protein [Actinomycetota bacterium]
MTNATRAKQGKRPTGPTPKGSGGRRSSSTWIAIAAVVAVVVLAAMFFSGGGDGEGGFAASAPGTVSIERASGPMLAAGDQVPDFEAPALQGGRTIAWSDVEGSPTVLAIWAPWCPHCQAELPRLSAAVEERPGIELVTITTAYGAQPGPTPPEYMADEGLSFPVAVDDEAQTLLRGMGVQSFPTTYYVAPDGTVVTATTGEVPSDELDAILDDLARR